MLFYVIKFFALHGNERPIGQFYDPSVAHQVTPKFGEETKKHHLRTIRGVCEPYENFFFRDREI